MAHNLRSNEQLLFLEIHRVDSSDFEASLRVTGICVGRYRILRASSPAVPNAIAAILIHIRDITGRLPHVYFNWTEGNPIGHMFRFLILAREMFPRSPMKFFAIALPIRSSGRLCISPEWQVRSSVTLKVGSSHELDG